MEAILAAARPEDIGIERRRQPVGIQAFYSLHAWVWELNSAGELQPWNPRVHC